MFTEKSQWIWHESGECANQYVVFKENFHAKAQSATLYICTEGAYAAWLNGEMISFGQFNDYTYERHFNEKKVILKDGDNELYILAYHKGIACSATAVGVASIRYEIPGILASTTDSLSGVHSSFDKTAPLITGQLGFSFIYDARKEKELVFSPSVIADVSCTLEPRPIDYVELLPEVKSHVVAQGVFRAAEGATVAEECQKAWIRPIYRWEMFRILPTYTTPVRYAASPYIIMDRTHTLKLNEGWKIEDDGIYIVFDLEREEAGYLSLSFTAQEGTIVDIAWGEHLDDLRVRSFIHRNYANRYIAKEGKNEFQYYIQRIACRYIQLYIHTTDMNFSLDYVGLIPAEYPFKQKKLDFSDKLHQQIYDTCLRTLILSAHEHYEDCPNREQSLYGFDSRNQMLFGYLAFDEVKMPASSLRILGLEEHAPGWQMLCAPAQNSITIPAFTCDWMLAHWEHYLYTKNDAYIQKELPRLKEVVRTHLKLFDGRFFKKDFGPGIWHFYEWAPDLSDSSNPDEFDAPYELFMLIEMNSALSLFKSIGETELVDEMSEVVEKLKKNIHDKFWSEEKQAYYTYIAKDGTPRAHLCELVQALAIYCDLPNEEQEKTLIAKLCNPETDWVKVTLSFSLFKYQAIMKEKERLDEVLADIAALWGSMLYRNATSFWETIVGGDDFTDGGSLCHGWSAVPIYIYFTYVLGIVPTAPGCFERKPIPCSLQISE